MSYIEKSIIEISSPEDKIEMSDTEIIEITNSYTVEVIEGHYVIGGVTSVSPQTPSYYF